MADGSHGVDIAAEIPQGLSWCSDETPGIRRRRAGKGWSYRDAKDQPIKDAKVLDRIRALAIPPAWTDVWICPRASGLSTRLRALLTGDLGRWTEDFGLRPSPALTSRTENPRNASRGARSSRSVVFPDPSGPTIAARQRRASSRARIDSHVSPCGR